MKIFQISFQLRSHDMCAYYSHFISRHPLCRTETGEVTEECPTLPEEEYEECELNIYCRRHELSLNILIFTHYLVINRAQISERVSMMFPHHSLCFGELLQSGLLGFLSLLLIEFWTPGQYLLTALYGKRGRHSENFTVFFITSIWIWMYPQKTSLNIVILF